MLLLYTVFLWSCGVALASDLVILAGDMLESHLLESKTTLVLFTKASGCSTCPAAADELRSVLPSLDVQAYSVQDEKITARYADRVPALVMFVGHAPVLYEGPLLGDAFAEFVTTNREPRVVALNDASFEHLTQASTGATTGDWLVMFHGLSCDRCEALESRLQGVAAKLRNRVMVAKVSSETDGRETAKRFGVAPTQMTILFFRQGVVYTYDVSRLDLTSLSAFAVGLYKDAPSRPVPELPQTPLMLALQVVAGVAVVAYILMLIVSKQREAAQKKKGF